MQFRKTFEASPSGSATWELQMVQIHNDEGKYETVFSYKIPWQSIWSIPNYLNYPLCYLFYCLRTWVLSR